MAETLSAFSKVQTALTSAPALAFPNLTKLFLLYTDEYQRSSPDFKAVAYLSKQLDPTTGGWTPCPHALAASALLIIEAYKLTYSQPLLYLPQSFLNLKNKALSFFSSSCLTHYQLTLTSPDITVLQSPILNPVILLPTSTPVSHSCIGELETSCLSDVPLPSPNFTLCRFIDRFSYIRNGIRYSAYKLIESSSLFSNTSAQKVELIALTLALTLAKGCSINI